MNVEKGTKNPEKDIFAKRNIEVIAWLYFKKSIKVPFWLSQHP